MENEKNCFRVNIKYKIRQKLFYFALTFIYILSQRSERIKDIFQFFSAFSLYWKHFRNWKHRDPRWPPTWLKINMVFHGMTVLGFRY